MSTVQATQPWYNLTDQGNALAFARSHSKNLKYCPERNKWLHWTGQIWQSDSDSAARQMYLASLKQRILDLETSHLDKGVAKALKKFLVQSENNGKVHAAMMSAQHLPEFIAKEASFDSDRMILATANGQIDLRTGGFGPARQESYCTFQIPVAYDPNATCKLWKKNLNDVFDGNEEVIRFFQKCVGYSMTGEVSEQVMFVCVGEGSNGKSTVLEVMKALLGSYASTAPFSTFDAKTRNDQTNDLARLKGRRFVSIVESDEDSYLAEAKVKHATGDEAITCRFFYKEFFEFHPHFKIWMATNRAPRVKGTDYGIQRRLLFIPFNRRFEGAERINGLKEMLFGELPGILNWALEGLEMWRAEGLKGHIPESIGRAAEEYKEDNDILNKWLMECVEKGDEKDAVRASLLYANYREYMLMSGVKPKGLPQWGADMKTKGLQKLPRDRNGERYVGIKLNQEVRI